MKIDLRVNHECALARCQEEVEAEEQALEETQALAADDKKNTKRRKQSLRERMRERAKK
jgi:hypothetical protein